VAKEGIHQRRGRIAAFSGSCGMRRREWLAGIGGIAICTAMPVRAQRQDRVARVGWLEWTNMGHFSEITGRAFVEGLREGGFVEGRNLIIERRVSLGDLKRLGEQARELAALKVDVLFAPNKAAADAGWYASRAIPTVIATVTDPVAVDYVVSLARPGKHITGVTTASAELTGKRLELLHEAVPNAKRIAVLYDEVLYDTCQQELKEFRTAARKLGVGLVEVPVRNLALNLGDLELAFRKVVDSKAEGIVMPLYTAGSDLTPKFARLALEYRMPMMHESNDFAEVGGLMSYGPDFAELYRIAAHFVVRILNGEKPADMPLEEPKRFKFTINLITAKAIGIVVPAALLARADELIQ
jgi:putative ABC transport system substrate-binding protein